MTTMKAIPRGKCLLPVLHFAAYLFLFTTTFNMASHGGGDVLSFSQQRALYYIHQIVFALGLLCFALARRCLHSERTYRALIGAALSVCALGGAALFLLRGAYVYLYVASAVVFCLGFLGGASYLRASRAPVESAGIAWIVGGGNAIAYGLQYPLQLLGSSPLLPFVMLAALAVVGRAALIWSEDETSAKTGCGAENMVLPLLCVCIVTAALVVPTSFYDGYIVELQIRTANGAGPFEWPRLLLVPVYLLFGWLGGKRDGGLVPLAALCTLLLALFHPLLVGASESYRLNMCLFYICIGAMYSYIDMTFLRVAARTRCPALWAPMGRVIDAAMAVALSLAHPTSFSSGVVLAVDVAALCVVIVFMTLSGELSMPFSILSPAPADAALGKRSGIAAFSENYGLTEKEREALTVILRSDLPMGQLAHESGISERTLYRHMNSICEKTGTDSRMGLVMLYYRDERP
ncbi:MAG: hypothetical protein E7474_10780 [Ruminococcaceae bacterium]|nr:hypothetical protein [Oscillospiraceae bacterium]